jgi:hypothetical protein
MFYRSLERCPADWLEQAVGFDVKWWVDLIWYATVQFGCGVTVSFADVHMAGVDKWATPGWDVQVVAPKSFEKTREPRFFFSLMNKGSSWFTIQTRQRFTALQICPPSKKLKRNSKFVFQVLIGKEPSRIGKSQAELSDDRPPSVV